MAKQGGIARRGVLAVVGVVATVLAGPGAVAPASAAPVGPFPSEVAFVQQAYRDFAGRDPSGPELFEGVAAVSGGGTAPQELLADLLVSPPTRGVVFPVFRLYEAYFGRGPDAAGLDFWVRSIRTGTPIAVVSDAFAASAEFTNRYGSLDNAEFVALVYRNVLRRAPDSGGLAHWTGVLDRGQAHRGQVMVGFSDSSEYAQKLKHVVRVAAAYFGMLGRVPTAAQYDRGVDLLASGGALHVLTGQIMATSAYRARIEVLWPDAPPPPPPPPSNGAVINVYNDPQHQLVIRDVLPFSTAHQDPTPPKRVRVKNVGTQTLVVSNVSIAGLGASAFRIVNSATSFSLAPNQETQVQVEYRPPALTGTRKGDRHVASLFFDSNDAGQPRDEVFLRGWHMREYENNVEPSRQEIVDTIGFTTNLGTGLPRDDVNAGDEVRVSGYFRKAGAGAVTLYPLARFSTRTIGATGNTRWFSQGTIPTTASTWHEIYKFAGCNCDDPLVGPGGENQKLVPTPDGPVRFTPPGNFGIGVRASGENLWSVDSLNARGQDGAAAHTFRFWPAEDRDGSVLPNTWIVGVDLGSSPDALLTKNWDYQDFMYVLSNAAPV